MLREYSYLASPYTHPDPFVREARYLQAMIELTRRLKAGEHVYSPIVHCHELAKIADLPRDAKFWEAYNHTMLNRSSRLVVLCLPGWKESKGVADEISQAIYWGLPIEYTEDEDGK